MIKEGEREGRREEGRGGTRKGSEGGGWIEKRVKRKFIYE